MEKKKPINSTELFRRINRLGAEVEWTTEELRDALREGGVEPDRLVNNIRAKVDHLLSEGRTNGLEGAGASAAPASLLAELRERTGLPATQIALKMKVTVPFLSTVGRYRKVVPISWRKELAARAEELGVTSNVVMNAFEHSYQAQMAASRDEAYAAEQVTPEQIIDQSGMDEKDKRYWLALAAEG
ncbi:MAG TPA: hypothetical protein VE262_17655 [Blastocatellia bacterium]|nr:hypothetical protein [Blastocatellia bacterium]